MTDRNFRRNALKTFGIAAGTAWLSSAMPTHARAAQDTSLLPAGASSLRELTQRLSKAPRRRDFKTVPMILQKPEQWITRP
ncbi:hypothetical protein QCE69_19505 [Caballeronia sp. LZ032]|nr:hypothetical protein [Caballeronia sp. LZ032]MDR5880465.1 hypothetical protein [Caballeronia sp. LZ032]